MLIRAGRPEDLPALTDLYNHYVVHSPATFDERPFTVGQRQEWFAHYAADGPYRLLVADDGGAIAGYATSSPFRPKPGYRSTVETTVYLAAEHTGRGLGTRLYRALFDALAGEDLHRAVAGVALPNPASVALHERAGFRPVGTFTEVGIKFGRLLDVAWFERPMADTGH